MTQPPEFPIRPIRPEAITAWVASLSSEEVLKLAQSVASGDLGRVLGDPFARPELDPVVLAFTAVSWVIPGADHTS